MWPNKNSSKQKSNKSDDLDSQSLQFTNRTEEEIGRLNTEILILNNKIRQVEKKVEDLQFEITKLHSNHEVDEKQKNLDDNQLSEINNQQENKENVLVEEVKTVPIELNIGKNQKRSIYYKAPFRERRFAFEQGNEALNSDVFYRIETDEESFKGQLTLLVNNDLTRALNSPHKFLEPACDYVNSYNSETNRIEVVSTGIVEKQENDWYVKEKVKIKFI